MTPTSEAREAVPPEEVPAAAAIAAEEGPAAPSPLVYRDAAAPAVSSPALAALGAGLVASPEVHLADAFFGAPDAPVLEAMRSQPLQEVQRGRGGRSLGFRLTLADGTQAYFKPDQEFNAMSWNAEVAAFHLDRALGLGRTAPVVSRRIPFETLREVASHDPRVGELHVDEEGELVGAMVFWVSTRPTPVELPDGWRRWVRLPGHPPSPISPFQTPGAYREALAAHQVSDHADEAPTPDRPERPAEMSDLIVFDYLTNNLDRWGGDNTNIRTVGPGGPLMFLDNAAGFTLRRARNGTMDLRLHEVQRFRRSTIDAVRALDVAAFAAQVNADPNGPLLDPLHVRNLAARRAHLLEHVDGLIAEHGANAVYAW